MKVKINETGDVISAEYRMTHFANGDRYYYYRDLWSGKEYPECDCTPMNDDSPADKVDWEQRLYETARDIFVALEHTNTPEGGYEAQMQAEIAVRNAQFLIEELKSKSDAIIRSIKSVV